MRSVAIHRALVELAVAVAILGGGARGHLGLERVHAAIAHDPERIDRERAEQPVRLGGHETERELPAPRMSDDERLLPIQTVEHGDRIVYRLGDRERSV